MRRSANITAAIACSLWTGLFFLGRELTFHIYQQGPGTHPNAAQIDFYMVFPLTVVSSLAFLAWIINGWQRWFAVLGVASAVSLFALLPFLLFYGGGV